MKNKISVSVSSALLIGSLFGGFGTADLAVYASSNDVTTKVAQQVGQFKDVPTNHYAFDAIEWGKNKGLINGYTDAKGKPNGLFGPEDNITEAQFVRMVSAYFGLIDTAGDLTKDKNHGTHWSDTYYDALAKYGVPLNGYFDNTVRDLQMKRGSVAQALGYLLGDRVDLENSIHFLLETGVTKGQNPQFEGEDVFKFFGSTNNLTRDQMISFLYRMDSKNMNEIGTIADMTAGDSISLNSKAKEGYSYVDVSIGGTQSTNNTGNYATFFGDKGSINTIKENKQEEKPFTLDEAHAKTLKLLNDQALKLLLNSKFKLSYLPSTSTENAYRISYEYNPTPETISILSFKVINNQIEAFTIEGYKDNVYFDMLSAQFGIDKSLFPFTGKDNGKTVNNYRLNSFGSMYGILLAE